MNSAVEFHCGPRMMALATRAIQFSAAHMLAGG